MVQISSTAGRLSHDENRGNCRYMANVCNRAGRFDEMLQWVKNLAKCGGELEEVERTMLAAAFYHVINPRRKSWQTVVALEQKVIGCEPAKLGALKGYRLKIQIEIESLCADMLSFIGMMFGHPAVSEGGQVFMLKVMGDCYRYLAEIHTGSQREATAQAGFEAYNSASMRAAASLRPVDTLQLGLALNFSVFLFEILQATDKAIEVAHRAWLRAAPELETMCVSRRKEVFSIIDLLHMNLKTWIASQQAGAK